MPKLLQPAARQKAEPRHVCRKNIAIYYSAFSEGASGLTGRRNQKPLYLQLAAY
ncbi:hypothetical protein [uncultured Ruegeria sp.]|uniref:hypothetical protein n=1 Tax=uncultured Ruegeria sp. TaxID=259304 RepID=UPI00260FE35F|nr:hypothetical protein [uncultured Ruegeria sp.]